MKRKILFLCLVLANLNLLAMEPFSNPTMNQDGICKMSAESVASGYLFGDRKKSSESFCRNYILNTMQNNSRCDSEKMIDECVESVKKRIEAEKSKGHGNE